MSRRKKKREVLTPSLFPFLAVLLCTMGALVLILMLVVGQAQATTRQVVTTKQEQTEEIEAHIELVRKSLEKERGKLQLELEKKRLTLQSFEDQIQQSLDELKKLSRTAELIDSQSSEVESDAQQLAKKITALEKLLAEAAEKLEKKLEKPTGEKPIFAIIPYEGPNGTHRRPVYLECTAEGVIVQPEGVLIGLRDLRPPYGPGNPLDAALRTVRNRYTPSDGALTSNAYPLLVVRPSGIQTYALARLAMAGWDDQFGYELVEDEMELAFPDGEPGLREEIEQSLAMARNRQAALVMAMPGKYRRYIEEFEDEPAELLGNGGNGFETSDSGIAGDRTAHGTGSLSSGEPAGEGGSTAEHSMARGGLDFDSPVTGSGVLSPEPGLLGPSAGFGDLSQPAQNAARDKPDGNRLSSNSSNRRPANSSGEGGEPNESNSTGATSAEAARMPPTRSTRQAGGTEMAGKLPTGSAGRAGSGGSGGSQMAQSGMAGAEAPSQTDAAGSEHTEQQAQGMRSISMNLNPQKQAEAVAKRKGRSWAWSGQSSQGTPVVRSIQLACYRDRWVVFPERQGNSSPVAITLDGPLQSSAEQLAQVISDRVDRWGVALAGGYWKPVLIVDVAYGGQSRFQQLVQLLEGSGIEIQRSLASP